MAVNITNTWLLFCITFGVMQLAAAVMGQLSKRFYTNDGTVRSFSVLDLEFAASATEIISLIKGIYLLPDAAKSKATIKALKWQLYVDFIFMPAAYGSVFLACNKVSTMLATPWGQHVFAVLAWLQLLPWLCDVLENCYLLGKIVPEPSVTPPKYFKLYQFNELVKWGLSLTGAVCSIAALFYFWLAGHFSPGSLVYLLIVLAEIIVIPRLVKALAGNKTA